jgi:hypothetical protein
MCHSSRAQFKVMADLQQVVIRSSSGHRQVVDVRFDRRQVAGIRFDQFQFKVMTDFGSTQFQFKVTKDSRISRSV